MIGVGPTELVVLALLALPLWAMWRLDRGKVGGVLWFWSLAFYLGTPISVLTYIKDVFNDQGSPEATARAFEMTIVAIPLALRIYAAYLYSRKDRRTPRVTIAWLLTDLALVAAGLFSEVAVLDGPATTDPLSEYAAALICLPLMILYWIKSKRVKATFRAAGPSNPPMAAIGD